MEAEGIINGVFPGEALSVLIPLEDTDIVERQGITSVRVIINDGRKLSNDQRRKIFALVGDITEWVKAPGKTARTRAERETLREMHLLYVIDALDGYEDSEKVRRQLTAHYCKLLDVMTFSLSNVDMTIARDFIDWLVELCVAHGIPCIDTLLNRCEDIQRYLYACVKNRRCAICGKKADIHEWGAGKPGMGGNRAKMHHSGQFVEPLCRLHHREIEDIGQQTFDDKYHLEPIALDDALCKAIGWKK